MFQFCYNYAMEYVSFFCMALIWQLEIEISLLKGSFFYGYSLVYQPRYQEQDGSTVQ